MLMWGDQMRAWSMEEIPLSYIEIPLREIWSPRISFSNANERKYVQLVPLDATANIYSYGYLYMMHQDVLEAKCSLDLWSFPFDTQTCLLSFLLMRFFEDIKGADVELMNAPQAYRFNSFPNDEWELLSTRSKTVNLSAKQYDRQADGTLDTTPSQVFTNLGTGFEVSIQLRRYCTYYIVNVIMPVVVLSLLDFVPFAIEEMEHEKIVTSVSVVLGFMFIQVNCIY